MCGRYRFTEEQNREILKIIEEVERKCGKGSWTPGEIRPTAKAPVLVASDDGPTPELYQWGYKLPKSLVINARAETAAEKPLFRESLTSMRCVVPSTGFWEWDADKRKFLFTLPGSAELYMAGLYAIREGAPCYCILTTAANESMREVHDRMPLVLTRDQVRPWLEQPERSAEFLRMKPPLLVKASEEAQIGLW